MSVAAVLAGCAAQNDIPAIVDDGPPVQCEGAGYVAFDAAHHAEQDARVGAWTQIGALLAEAVEAPSEAAAKMTAAEALYASTAELKDKVAGRTDDHLADRPAVGAAIDARITAAFAAGRAATDAQQVEVAAEIIDKSLAEFFYLSVVHELFLGAAAKWDEAFGYYGAPADNALDGVQGLADVARRRDGNNGTALEARVFAGLKDGSCALAERLAELGVQELDAQADERLGPIVADIDQTLQQVFAYSVGHEAFEIADARAASDAATARVKLIELDGFFLPLERLLLAAGGDDAAAAVELRAALDAALADDGDAWLAAFPDAAVVATIEARYGIDVRE